jgi:hypothetical protein
MQLLANRLFTYYGQSPPTYTLTGWEPKKCKKEAVGSVFPSGQSGQAWSSTGPDCAKAGFWFKAWLVCRYLPAVYCVSSRTLTALFVLHLLRRNHFRQLFPP